MTDYENTLRALRERPRTWVVAGVAGFIGSNLLEALLRLNQKVVGLDNFSSGHRHNLAQVKDAVTREQWGLFRLMAEDVCSVDACRQACSAAHFVLPPDAIARALVTLTMVPGGMAMFGWNRAA